MAIPLWLTSLIWGGSTFDLYVGKLDITFTQISAVNYDDGDITHDWSATLPDMDVGTVRAVSYILYPRKAPPTGQEYKFTVKIYLPSQGQYSTSSSKIETASVTPLVTNDSIESSAPNIVAGGSLLLDDYVAAVTPNVQNPNIKGVKGTFYVARIA